MRSGLNDAIELLEAQSQGSYRALVGGTSLAQRLAGVIKDEVPLPELLTFFPPLAERLG